MLLCFRVSAARQRFPPVEKITRVSGRLSPIAGSARKLGSAPLVRLVAYTLTHKHTAPLLAASVRLRLRINARWRNLRPRHNQQLVATLTDAHRLRGSEH